MPPVRAAALGISVLTVVAVAAFIAGVVFGVMAGDLNAEIDFCADDGSGRYIADPSSRKQSCD